MSRQEDSTATESEADAVATATGMGTMVHSRAGDLCLPARGRAIQNRKNGNTKGIGGFGEGNRSSDQGRADGRNWLLGRAGKRDLDVPGNGEMEMAYSPPANRRSALERNARRGNQQALWQQECKELPNSNQLQLKLITTHCSGAHCKPPARDVAQCKPPDCRAEHCKPPRTPTPCKLPSRSAAHSKLPHCIAPHCKPPPCIAEH